MFRSHRSNSKRMAGSLFEGVMRMRREEMEDARRVVRTLLPPVETWPNGARLPERALLASWEATLPMESPPRMGCCGS